MIDLLLPEFFLALLVLLVLIAEAMSRLDQAWARPAVAVYLTIGAWYFLDFVYNDWSPRAKPFAEPIIARAFLQIAWFLLAYRIILEFLKKWAVVPPRPGMAMADIAQWNFFRRLFAAQVFFMLVGLIRTGGDPWNLFYPPAAAVPTSLWGRGGVGEGFDFLVAAAGYTHIAIIAMLGVVIATTDNPRLRAFAAVVFILAMPPYLFQRARNLILATLFPGILAYVLVGRATWVTKATFAAGAFCLINLWFLVVITSRDGGGGIGRGGMAESFEAATAGDARHSGLDMLSELCYIDTFIDSRHYTPNFGERYFAEVVAIVPRTIWPSKPFIGIDYSIARGFADSRASHGVNTTVATGMIGQGVVNFGVVLGPVASATLMALWTLILARLWNRRRELPSLCLFLLGLGLTFNMGRDITLLVLFPFVFAAVGVYGYEYFSPRKREQGF